MAQSAALTQFLQALGDVHEYHTTLGLILDIAREGAGRIPKAEFAEVLRRHIPGDRVSEYDIDAWRLSAEHVFPNRLTVNVAVSPNNLLVIVLVAHFEAFLENLRAERGYPWPKGIGGRRQGRHPACGDLVKVYRIIGADLDGCGWTWDDVSELVQKRHCIVHRGARVNDEYLDKLKASPRLGPQRPYLPSEGDHWRVIRLQARKLRVTNDELLLHLKQLHEIAVVLDATCPGPSAHTAHQ